MSSSSAAELVSEGVGERELRRWVCCGGRQPGAEGWEVLMRSIGKEGSWDVGWALEVVAVEVMVMMALSWVDAVMMGEGKKD